MDATHTLLLGIVGAIAVSALKPSTPKAVGGVGTASVSTISQNQKFNTPEHAKYKHVRWGGASSQSTSSIAPITGGSPELKARLNAEFASLPKALQEATQTIALRPGCSPRWGCDGAAATATSPGGLIEVWQGSGDYFPLLAHEAGHLLAYQKWGDSKPPQEYVALWQSEGGVSEYGSKSPTEDFAEAVQHYVDGKPLSERKRAFVQKALNE